MTPQRILVSAVMVALAACELDAGHAVSPIEITSATVITNASSYVVGEPITITWSGLPGNALDWVEYLPVGGDDHNPTRWAYTGGAASGSITLEGALADGTYVARAFLDDSYVKLGESAGFGVGSVAGAIIEPPPLVSDTFDWNPNGIHTASWVRADTDGVGNIWRLTGIVAPSNDGKILHLTCVGASAGIIAIANDETSAPANRFIIPSPNDTLEVSAGNTITFIYDDTAQRWRVLSKSF